MSARVLVGAVRVIAVAVEVVKDITGVSVLAVATMVEVVVMVAQTQRRCFGTTAAQIFITVAHVQMTVVVNGVPVIAICGGQLDGCCTNFLPLQQIFGVVHLVM